MKKYTLYITMFTFLTISFALHGMEWRDHGQNSIKSTPAASTSFAQSLANKFDQPDEKAFLAAIENSDENTLNKQYLNNRNFIDQASIGLLVAAYTIAQQQNNQRLQTRLRAIIDRQFPYANRR